jgi:hypothetical protein
MSLPDGKPALVNQPVAVKKDAVSSHCGNQSAAALYIKADQL